MTLKLPAHSPTLLIATRRAKTIGWYAQRVEQAARRQRTVFLLGEILLCCANDLKGIRRIDTGKRVEFRSGGRVEEIEEFSDDRQKAWCVHCGAWLSNAETNWDHVPSKSLLDRPLPAHVPQVKICRDCNSGFSLDEEYFVAFFSCVLAGSTAPEAQTNPKVRRAFERNPALFARIDAAKQLCLSPDGNETFIWQPELERIHKVILKNARGHAFFEFGEPMLQEPEHVRAMPLDSMNPHQRAAFEDVGAIGDIAGWAEVGSRMMTRQITGQDMDGGWVVAQSGVYRYAVFQDGSITVRSVLREYLATEVFWP